MGTKDLKRSDLKRYLEERTDKAIQIEELRLLGSEARGEDALKQFGYGQPILVSYRIDDQEERSVFHRVRRNAFGREREDDRIAAAWLDFHTFNDLPRHVPAVDLVGRTEEGALRSLHWAEEVLLVTNFCPGQCYADDLLRLCNGGELEPQDVQRVEALATYLAEIHQVKKEEPLLWQRRLRDLVGHGEGIMGQTDSYPTGLPYAPEERLRRIEEQANRWRWRLKPMHHRLRQVHGDFHPFNVLFAQGTEFYLLDRSRGAWGEPADDVSCMTINYLFFSLQRSGWLEEPFSTLHQRFWDRYLAHRPDEELVQVIQPWLAWRALVLASPIWYPNLVEEVRRKLLTFALRVMSEEQYDYGQPDRYLEEA